MTATPERGQSRPDKVRLKFKHAGGKNGGLVAKGNNEGKLARFAVAGEDGKWHWAEAKVEGETVAAWSPQVPKPVAVRYAWADNPEGANLYNGAGLPAVPFRTDDWKGVTADNR